MLAAVAAAAVAGTLAMAPAGMAAAPASASWFVNWSQMNGDVQGSADNPSEHRVTSATVEGLSWKWSALAPPNTECSGGTSLPVLGGGRLYRALPGGSIEARNPFTGALLWATAPLPGLSLGQPAFLNGRIYATAQGACSESGGGFVEVFDAATGHQLPFLDPAGESFTIDPYLAAVGNRIYGLEYEENGAYLYAGDATTGVRLWKTAADPNSGWNVSPVIDKAAFVTVHGELTSLALATGHRNWNQPAVKRVLAAWKAQNLILGMSTSTGAGDLIAVNETTGKIAWKIKGATGPVTMSAGLLVAACGKDLCGVGPGGGRKWTATNHAGVPAALSMAADVVYASYGDSIQEYNAATGEPFYTPDLDDSSTHPVAVANGFVYVTDNRVLDAFYLDY